MAGKKKKQLTRAKKSYNAYKRQYLEWKSKGYHMEKLLNFKSYKTQVFDLATKIGKPNIARETARASRSWSYSELRDIFERNQEISRDYSRKEILSNYSRKTFFDVVVEKYGGYETAERVIYG